MLDDEESTSRMESKLDELRMKWAGSNYEVVLEKLEMMESWRKSEVDSRVKLALMI